MSDRPKTQLLSRRQTAGRLLQHRPDLSVVRNQRRRARELAASLGNRAGVINVLAAWLGGNPDSDVRDLSTVLDNRLQLHLVSVPPQERTPEVTEAGLVEEAFGLGWEQLTDSGVAEALMYISLAAGLPIPQELVSDLAQVSSDVLEAIVEAGFAQRDDSACLTIDGSTLQFLDARQEPSQERPHRQLQFALGIRNHCGTAAPGRVEIDALGELATNLLRELQQPLPIASLSHRLAERARRRGDLSGAMVWIRHGSEIAQKLADDGLPFLGLFALDEACVVLQEKGALSARPHVHRAARILSAANNAGHPGAGEALFRARLLRAQIEGATQPVPSERELRTLTGKLQRQQDTPARAVALQSLGSACFHKGDHKVGRELLGEARKLLESLDSSEDGALASLLVAEAQSLSHSNNPEIAHDLLERARVLGGGDMDRPPQPSLPLALHELGLAAGNRGDQDAAATLLDEAAMLATSLLPPFHPVRATTAYSRGLLFLSHGEFRRAEKQIERALAGWSGAYPTDHPIQSIGRAARAWVSVRSGEISPEEAVATVDIAIGALVNAPGWTEQLQSLRANLAAVPV